MKKRTYLIYLEDILNAMIRIQNYIVGMEYKDFVENTMASDAVIRNLEIMGEAAKNIPNNIRKRYLDMPWKRMIGLRNIAIHKYFSVDLAIVWRIVTKNIPETRPMLEKLIQEIKTESL